MYKVFLGIDIEKNCCEKFKVLKYCVHIIY